MASCLLPSQLSKTLADQLSTVSVPRKLFCKTFSFNEFRATAECPITRTMHEVHERQLDDGMANPTTEVSGEFLGRAVWFECTNCGRVRPSGDMVRSGEAWEERSVALRLCDADPRDMWWFQTLCECCRPPVSPQTPLTDPGVSDAALTEAGQRECIVYRTHLIWLLSSNLGHGMWVPTAWILPSAGAGERNHFIGDDSISPLPTRNEANALATQLAMIWIDSLYSSPRNGTLG